MVKSPQVYSLRSCYLSISHGTFKIKSEWSWIAYSLNPSAFIIKLFLIQYDHSTFIADIIRSISEIIQISPQAYDLHASNSISLLCITRLRRQWIFNNHENVDSELRLSFHEISSRKSSLSSSCWKTELHTNI